MILPEEVKDCLERLEKAGFSAYVVGGCVRDALLGLSPHDYDLCTGATPEQTKQVFAGENLVLAGEKHGTVGVVTAGGVVEITTFRTEGGYRDGRHPGWVAFAPRVEDDLARRDFTVNAMAFSPSRGLIDPFGGRQDLENRVLRAVGEPERRFQEDALRILRGARFAVCYGLRPQEETLRAMASRRELLARISAERIFSELNRLLLQIRAEELLTFEPILTQVLPELAPTVGFDQHSPHHAYDLFTHTAYVTAAVPPDPALRWAALLHDVGKVSAFTLDENGRGHFHGHARLSARMAEEVLLRLKAPTALREEAVNLIARHMTPLEPDKKLLRRRMGSWGPEAVKKELALQRADTSAKGVIGDAPDYDRIESLLEEILAEDACLTVKDLAVNGRDLMTLGYVPGPALGVCLDALLGLVADELLPNEKQALLDQAAQWLPVPEDGKIGKP